MDFNEDAIFEFCELSPANVSDEFSELEDGFARAPSI